MQNGINDNLSEYFAELDADIIHKESFIASIGSGVADQIKADRERKTLERIESAKAQAEKEEKERMKQECGFTPTEKDAYSALNETLAKNKKGVLIIE